MQVSREIIEKIADDLDSGFKCFVHKETTELVTFLDEDRFPGMDAEEWQDEIDKIENDPEKYIEVENMSSKESFRVIEEFSDSVHDISVKNRLTQAIQGHKPFANFKLQIDNSGDFRELWFAFKRNKMIEWVENQLSANFH